MIQTISFKDFLYRVGKNNLDFLAEQYNVNIAEAEVIAQKVLPDPELSFEAADENFSLGLGYSLELGNKRGARVRLAKSQAELERLALEYFYQELRAEATGQFLEVIQQRELMNVKQRSYEYMLQLSRSDSIRFRLGEITEIDARQSKLEATTLLNEVYEQEAAYRSAVAELFRLMGQAPDEAVGATAAGDWEAFERSYVLEELIEQGLALRVDLMAAHKKMEVAVNQHKLLRAERRPDLGLSLSYERDWEGFLPPSRSVKAGVSIPLKFSNLNKGAIRVSKHGIDQTKLQQQSTGLQVRTEIAQAYFQYEAAGKKAAQYRSGLLDDSRKILEGIVYKYQRGETDILEVLMAQRTYNEVQEQYLEAMKGYASAVVGLQKVCGIWDVEF